MREELVHGPKKGPKEGRVDERLAMGQERGEDDSRHVCLLISFC
jgi:hypothetical protein